MLILSDFEHSGYAVIDDFLPSAVVDDILLELREIRDRGLMKQAGIGRESNFQVNAAERGDSIRWINPLEAGPATKTYLDKLDEVVRELNRGYYLGLRDFECHFAEYPVGTFYRRHSDRHKSGSSRVVSLVFYLNHHWKEEDGGQLVLYPESSDPVPILPSAGRLALFLSEIEHEVLPTNRQRASITGWMLNEPRLW